MIHQKVTGNTRHFLLKLRYREKDDTIKPELIVIRITQDTILYFLTPEGVGKYKNVSWVILMRNEVQFNWDVMCNDTCHV